MMAWLRRLLHVDEHEADVTASARERARLERQARERTARLESLDVEGKLLIVPRHREPPR